MIVGIVGSESRKFTPDTEALARAVILRLLTQPGITGVSSGHCHLGGVDIYAEEAADFLGLPKLIFAPKTLKWESYKQRNLQIVEASDTVVCITVRVLPPDYSGMRFTFCYHCRTTDHVKSGGCWTVKQAIKRGKLGSVVIV